MRSKFKVLAAVLVLPWLAVSVFGARYVSASELSQPAAQGTQTFTVLMGAEYFTEEGDKSSWFSYRFFPEKLTIIVGDTIMFKHNSGLDVHTATFLGPMTTLPEFFIMPDGAQQGPPPTRLEVNPLILFPQGGNSYDGSQFVSSGGMAADIPGPKEYSVSFPKAGTYQYICLVHTEQYPDGTRRPMMGTVTVQAAGSAYPMTPAQVDAAAKEAIEADRAIATASEPKAEEPAVVTRAATNGSMIHRVNTGYIAAASNGTDDVDYLRFSPKVLTINAGDTVEWAVPTPHGFHNIMFGEEPTLFNFEPQPAGPPKVFTPAEVFFPVGPNVHTGTGLYSAGIVRGSSDPPGPFGQSYSLTFTQPGRYEYICALHYNQGMDGTIIVQDRTGGSTVGMPRTGSSSGTEWFLPLLAAALLLAGTGVTLRLRTRRVTK
ncbi:MAG: plastocyanin/azurin family copper-binding protein [Chloroflexota bacterium]|nr:plastocyanin/azurin family copper-binding protein [Chloroflexota bacterium]